MTNPHSIIAPSGYPLPLARSQHLFAKFLALTFILEPVLPQLPVNQRGTARRLQQAIFEGLAEEVSWFEH